MTLVARTLSPEAFAPFGDVLTGLDNQLGPERHEFAARFQNLRERARPNLTFMRVPLAVGELLVRALERHPFSNQAFVPLNGTSQLVVVCPSDAHGRPVLGALRAFVATGSQAVNYHAGVWHAPRTALGAPGEFIMFRWDDGSDGDTEVVTLDIPIRVAREGSGDVRAQ